MTFVIGVTMVSVFLVFVALNVPIAVGLGISTIVTMLIFDLPFSMYADIIFTGLAKYTLLAIPFFIMSGLIMEKSGISTYIVEFARLLVGRTYGGFAMMSIIVTLFWGAISGSAPATVAALGSVLIPAMINQGYDKGFAASTIAASSGVAIVIPPSVTLVVYGVLANVSVGDLFLAGIVPGLVMGACFCCYAWIVSRREGYRSEESKAGRQEIWAAFKNASLGLLTPVIILGGIYGGIFTPTEAAAVSVLYALIIGVFIYRTIKIRDLPKILADTGVSTASLMIVMANAGFFAWLLTSRGVGASAANTLIALSENGLIVLLLCSFILVMAGCFIDGMSITYIFLPVMLPVVKRFGYDPLWFGVLVSMSIAIGCITPPVAVNLFPACRIADIPLSRISISILGFVAAALVSLVLMVLFPQLAMFLPKTLPALLAG